MAFVSIADIFSRFYIESNRPTSVELGGDVFENLLLPQITAPIMVHRPAEVMGRDESQDQSSGDVMIRTISRKSPSESEIEHVNDSIGL